MKHLLWVAFLPKYFRFYLWTYTSILLYRIDSSICVANECPLFMFHWAYNVSGRYMWSGTHVSVYYSLSIFLRSITTLVRTPTRGLIVRLYILHSIHVCVFIYSIYEIIWSSFNFYNVILLKLFQNYWWSSNYVV